MLKFRRFLAGRFGLPLQEVRPGTKLRDLHRASANLHATAVLSLGLEKYFDCEIADSAAVLCRIERGAISVKQLYEYFTRGKK